MRSNSLKTKQRGLDSRATPQGPKPGDFTLGSAESRAAARAIVHRLAEKDGPQPGDIIVDLGFLAPKRVAEVYCLIRSDGEPTGTLDRIPGKPLIWIKPPEGFDQNSLPESTPPLTFRNAPDDLLMDAIECYNKAFRKAKRDGKTIPAELDPDLVWNGTAHVPKKNG